MDKKPYFIDFEQELIRELKESETDCVEFLQATLKESDPRVFFAALDFVVQARRGITLLELLNQLAKMQTPKTIKKAAIKDFESFLHQLSVPLGLNKRA